MGGIQMDMLAACGRSVVFMTRFDSFYVSVALSVEKHAPILTENAKQVTKTLLWGKMMMHHRNRMNHKY